MNKLERSVLWTDSYTKKNTMHTVKHGSWSVMPWNNFALSGIGKLQCVEGKMEFIHAFCEEAVAWYH